MTEPTPLTLAVTPLFGTAAVDRATHLRSNPAALAAGWASARLLWVDHAGRFLVDDDGLHLAPAAATWSALPPGAVFLGVDDDEGRPHVWAVRAEVLPADSLAGGLTATDLRHAGAGLTPAHAEFVVSAVALLTWHDRARFSPVDGSPTDPTPAGWSRVSRATGAEEFPRTDPAMICLVHDGADRVLLVRQRAWSAGRHSVLAGFVEAGESLEMCVAREIREEVGLDVSAVTYLGSQPWPFPRSVMIGFSAVADPGQPLQFLDGEIAEGRWFTRAEVRTALELGDWATHPDGPASLLLPGPISISRRMIEAWADTVVP